MIQGLKVTIPGPELHGLCHKHADYHEERAQVYQKKLDLLQNDGIEAMDYTNGDPKKPLGDKALHHGNAAKELRFIAEHLDLGEQYLLDQTDLAKLGITQGRFSWP